MNECSFHPLKLQHNNILFCIIKHSNCLILNTIMEDKNYYWNFTDEETEIKYLAQNHTA